MVVIRFGTSEHPVQMDRPRVSTPCAGGGARARLMSLLPVLPGEPTAPPSFLIQDLCPPTSPQTKLPTFVGAPISPMQAS